MTSAGNNSHPLWDGCVLVINLFCIIDLYHKQVIIYLMNRAVKKYLAGIGRKGGQRSRRSLSPETARMMVRIREAKRAFTRFHAQCFWSSPKDYEITEKDLEWVADRLMTYGGREGWRLGTKLCR